jgi:flap endonuclease-1
MCKVSIRSFAGKTIVVDTSIYMYKFTAQSALIENMYLMISIFLQFDITPIFIFEGKPPVEKRKLLNERSKLKKDAEAKYNFLKNELDQVGSNDENRREIELEMESLKKKFIRIKQSDIARVKLLMDAYGVPYHEAEGESDLLCASLVKSGKAWACLSDDMDMFVYGCNRVLRHFSLLQHTVILYDTDAILNDLNMTLSEFRKIMVLSGTDYNIGRSNTLNETMKQFANYKNDTNNGGRSFYEWLNTNTNFISNYEELLNIHDMFCVDNSRVDYSQFILRKANINNLKRILFDEGFIFV